MKYITGLALFFFAIAGLTITSILFTNCAGFARRGQAGEGVQADEAETSGAAAEGIYEGTGKGYRGPIRVRLRMEAGTISEIVIVDSKEDRAVGGAAMEELLDLVLMYNTTSLDVTSLDVTDIDAISGATESSAGFLAAVENALKAAR